MSCSEPYFKGHHEGGYLKMLADIMSSDELQFRVKPLHEGSGKINDL